MARVSQSETTWHEQRDKWAKIWFEKLCHFHGRKPQAIWEFTADDVIAFLRDHLRRKTPAWKRLKIIQSLICYRRYVQTAPFDDLTFIRTKLEQLTRAEKVKEERLRESGEDSVEEIEDVVGYIDPSEPDVIQNLRRREGTDICTIQELLGHADIKTTRTYLHSLNREDVKVVSPLDRMSSNRHAISANDDASESEAREVTPEKATASSTREGSAAGQANDECSVPADGVGVSGTVSALAGELAAPNDRMRLRQDADLGQITERRMENAGPPRCTRQTTPSQKRQRWWSQAARWGRLRASVIAISFLFQS
ncbi:hypothetical protein [Allorhodopirellula solitaria]|uniref:Uncharacterized protein n=1 Tax=Allorhodopirellula solitaria TaxID=2527987 RepID=A0A5C5X387_9BACT|nr:hypothetical protein [Allorhodopirellula solitaria]TWT56615.1 hypothetical protein CA85_41490 [Allorhodopirellula solitaria]